jgi:hypothetical protein
VGQINKEWHLVNKMPKNPTPKQRLDWHIAHSQNCLCRPFSDEMRYKLEAKIGSK